MFSKILIANRGEIAVRIIRACKEMGIATVAIYSQADRDALHVALADESYCVGGASPGESYLNEERVVSAALVSGAQAIHPGYGFLSENAHFAALCRKNGLVFIGPSPESMEELSDKARLKEIMGRNGLEVIPGTQVLTSAQAALAAAAEIGYPVMLKASAGGGVVTATVSGKRELKALEIDPDAVDPDDVEMLEDLIVAAVNEAMRAAEGDAASTMQKLTGGLGLSF